MASTNKQINQPVTGKRSPFLLPLIWIYSIVKYLVIALLIGIIIEWVGMTFWWPTDHAEQTFNAEILFQNTSYTTSITGHSPAELSKTTTSYVQTAISENVVVTYLSNLSQSQPTNAALRTIANSVYQLSGYFEAALFTTLTITMRATIIMLSLGLILIVALLSTLDGLIERELRHYGGDGEHSRIVHLAKDWVPRFAKIAPILYLGWPEQANPVYFFLPAMLALGFTNFIFVANYQKRF